MFELIYENQNQQQFCCINILDEQNSEAHGREIQCPQLLPITSVPQPDEVPETKRNPIYKILQSEQALAQYHFRISEGILAHQLQQQSEQLAIDALSYMIHNLRKSKRTYFARSLNENGTNANYFNLAANTINSYLNNQIGSHLLEACVIKKSDSASNDSLEITNLLFEVQQLGQGKVKTKKFHQLMLSTIWKQIMRPMLNQNENQTLEQNQETQIVKVQNDMPLPNSGLRGQPPLQQSTVGPYVPRNAARLQATIFSLALNAEQHIQEILNIMTKETIQDNIQKDIKGI
ncbi:MAG: hypothetical protein EZS28_009879 [Streblomastix strix]|uniref:Uncharacterized protein n=1 Tax=Streblomastix strix TaxID=222440 RepID=A0A5J4WIP5_9EUKA|nr:MAG: hypothetical protein EZS28_009879 [Streblomastix strix]